MGKRAAQVLDGEASLSKKRVDESGQSDTKKASNVNEDDDAGAPVLSPMPIASPERKGKSRKLLFQKSSPTGPKGCHDEFLEGLKNLNLKGSSSDDTQTQNLYSQKGGQEEVVEDSQTLSFEY